MTYILISKSSDGWGKAVKPEMERPECYRNDESDWDCPECKAYYLHLQSLPTIDVDLRNAKDFKKGDSFEGREQWQYNTKDKGWVDATKDVYLMAPVEHRRILLVPVEITQAKEPIGDSLSFKYGKLYPVGHFTQYSNFPSGEIGYTFNDCGKLHTYRADDVKLFSQPEAQTERRPNDEFLPNTILVPDTQQPEEGEVDEFINPNKLKFGDTVINHWASERNPNRKGIVIKVDSKSVYCTDGNGRFWNLVKDSKAKIELIGNALIAAHPSEQEAPKDQQALAFGEWLGKRGWYIHPQLGWTRSFWSGKTTTQELYNQSKMEDKNDKPISQRLKEIWHTPTAPALEQVGKERIEPWVSVEDFPKKSGWYLTFDPNYPANPIDILQYDSYNGGWRNEVSDAFHPSHWKLLPQPPKQ